MSVSNHVLIHFLVNLPLNFVSCSVALVNIKIMQLEYVLLVQLAVLLVIISDATPVVLAILSLHLP